MADQVEVDIRVNVQDGELAGLKDKIKKAGNEGEKAFKKMESTSGSCLTSFMGNLNLTENQLRTLEDLTRTWGDAFDFNKAKLERLGVDTESLRGKIQLVGNTITSYMGTKWNTVNAKVSEVANSIKTKLGGAINSVKSRFSGLTAGFKNLQASANNAGKGMGFLRSTASMTVGMIGYDLVMGMSNAARESINAAGKMEAFGKRLGMTSSEIQSFSAECDKLQKDFKKVDMRAVGASAEELGVKLNIPKGQMGELTKMTAVMSSAFVNEGRTQEDAILAVSDAMDGQFKRLQELGITQDKLKANGWNGNLEDTNSLMQAMNKTMDEMGFTETAQGIYTLDDAYKALEVAGGRLLADVLIPLTPVITGMVDVVVSGIDTIKQVVGGLKSAWDSLPDWAQYAIGITGFALAIGGLVSYIGMAVTAAGGLAAFIGGLLGPLGTVITVIGGISWPIVAAVAAVAALGVAIYELGKYFGWWSDVSSMFDAIVAGLQRMWDAFINHPDVQAVIQALGDAWNWLCDALQPVIQWLGEIWDTIFPPGAAGQVDAVGTILETLGAIWNALTMPIKLVIAGVKAFFQLLGMASDAGGDAFNTIYETLSSVWEVIQFIGAQVFNLFLPVINGLQVITSVIQGMFTGQIGILDGLMIIGQTVANMFVGFWSALGNLFLQGFMTVANYVAQGIMNIWNSFLGFLAQLATIPGQVWAYLMNVVSRVVSWASNMVSKAQSAATNFVNSIINGIANLPSRFRQSIDRVLTELGNWGKQMVDKAAQIMRDVANYIGQITGLTGASYEGFNINSDIGYSGFSSNDIGVTGVNTGGMLNNSLGTISTANNSKLTINNNFSGIIEEPAADFITSKVNEKIKKQIITRGL